MGPQNPYVYWKRGNSKSHSVSCVLNYSDQQEIKKRQKDIVSDTGETIRNDGSILCVWLRGHTSSDTSLNMKVSAEEKNKENLPTSTLAVSKITDSEWSRTVNLNPKKAEATKQSSEHSCSSDQLVTQHNACAVFMAALRKFTIIWLSSANGCFLYGLIWLFF